MKYILFVIFFLPFFLKSQPLPADRSISKTGLQQTVALLSSDSLQGRLTGSAGASIAAAYIAATFTRLGLQPLAGHYSYYDSFPANIYRQKLEGLNVIGVLPSSTGIDTLVIFSAHYDHIGKGNDLGYNKDYRIDDDIYNGANDNATGVAAMLELAKYYKAQNLRRYTLVFIGFAGEELGLVGSTELVKKLNTKLIKAVINLEMLGRPVNNNCYIISLGNGRLKKYLNKELTDAGVVNEKDFFGSDTYYEEDLAHRSDHYPFARKIKNAFTIMATSPTDKYYHSVDDEYNTIDFDFLLKAVKNIAIASHYFTR